MAAMMASINNPNISTFVVIGLILTAGTMLVTWLGEQITERGIKVVINFENGETASFNYFSSFEKNDVYQENKDKEIVLVQPAAGAIFLTVK